MLSRKATKNVYRTLQLPCSEIQAVAPCADVLRPQIPAATISIDAQSSNVHSDAVAYLMAAAHMSQVHGGALPQAGRQPAWPMRGQPSPAQRSTLPAVSSCAAVIRSWHTCQRSRCGSPDSLWRAQERERNNSHASPLGFSKASSAIGWRPTDTTARQRTPHGRQTCRKLWRPTAPQWPRFVQQ